jgi:hypothetical protein
VTTGAPACEKVLVSFARRRVRKGQSWGVRLDTRSNPGSSVEPVARRPPTIQQERHPRESRRRRAVAHHKNPVSSLAVRRSTRGVRITPPARRAQREVAGARRAMRSCAAALRVCLPHSRCVRATRLRLTVLVVVDSIPVARSIVNALRSSRTVAGAWLCPELGRNRLDDGVPRLLAAVC